ncbi:MAG: aspartate--tRNA ligase [Thermomicrobiales bacterium]|nr:aspartate--tRNA ligase [Thermomicrobiales bacterium]
MTVPHDVEPATTGRLTCGSLRIDDVGKEVVLRGWVNRRRDLGGLIFIDLRDRYGMTQVVFNPEIAAKAHEIASDVRSEYVLQISGVVRERPEGTRNPKLATGDIEVEAHEIEILNTAKTPPFEISQATDVDESVRLRYRYLDLRRARMQRNIILRHALVRAMREYLSERGFIEVETPTLIKSTPEGARDFLVPSSGHPGNFYALPQSPQQMKQLLMVAGIDRYFQIARCFRDEPQRADRQPEFTQLDIEMSFVDQDDVMRLIEELYIELTREFSDKRIQEIPFPRLTYVEAMERFGNDRPDLRFGLELQDVSAAFRETGFRAFAQTLESGGQIKAIVIPSCAGYTRKQIDELTEIATRAGARGLATFAVTAEGIRSSVAKFLGESEIAAITSGIGAGEGDLVLAVADQPAVVAKALSALRDEFGQRLGLADPNVMAFCWVYEFPLLEWNEEEARWEATHNPFSGYLAEDAHLLESEPGAVRARQYDLVGNGNELGGGSVRNHRREDQQRLFSLMGYSPEDTAIRFGALLDALDYGAPPHGGIAMGVDRFAMLLANEENIREVIAFPKNQRGLDLMFQAPDAVGLDQLGDLALTLDESRRVRLWESAEEPEDES